MSNHDPDPQAAEPTPSEMEAAMAAAPSLPKEAQGQLSPEDMEAVIADLRAALARLGTLLG